MESYLSAPLIKIVGSATASAAVVWAMAACFPHYLLKDIVAVAGSNNSAEKHSRS